MADTEWLACRQRRPEAAVRLYCFPHSGGTVGEYLRWSDGLPGLELWGVNLPGRGRRMFEEPYRRLEELTGAIADAVSFRPPFALFGHSLGAVAAFEIARTLRDRGGPEPRALILSSYQAPHLPRAVPDVHGLPDEQLLPIVERQYGELSTELRDDPDFMRFTLGYHRADFEMIETYRYREGRPLSVPLIVTGGTEDYPLEALEAWRRHTTGSFSMSIFPGDHFYLREQREGLLRLIASTLTADDPSTSSRRVA